MVYEPIVDVGKTLTELIFNNLDDVKGDQLISTQNDITLSSPENSKGKLSLFLYKINENTFLKNQDVFFGTDSKIVKYPPIFLSLFYLITPNTKNDENDQIIIGKILQIIHDHGILRGSILPDSLRGDEIRLILNGLSIDDLNKIWTIVSGTNPYKLSISLEVTPVRIDSGREREVTRVTERDLDYYEKQGDRND